MGIRKLKNLETMTHKIKQYNFRKKNQINLNLELKIQNQEREKAHTPSGKDQGKSQLQKNRFSLFIQKNPEKHKKKQQINLKKFPLLPLSKIHQKDHILDQSDQENHQHKNQKEKNQFNIQKRK